MAERKINPLMKQVLELGPTIVFFLIYLRIRDNSYVMGGIEYTGFIVATLIFVPILLISMAALWVLTGKLSRIQIFTAFMVIVFGGLTAYFNDERFFKMKTTIVYGLFAAILGIGLLRGQSYLQWVLEDFLPMEPEGWMILTKRITWLFLALGAANELIWRTQSTDLWVKLETFAFPVVMFVFLWSQIVLLQKYLIDPTPED